MKSDSYIYRQTKTLNIRGRLMTLSTPQIMGILNVTPDSFFAENRFITEAAILAQAEKMLAEGASIIDIGGYSSRPGTQDVSLEEELSRTVNAVKLIAKRFPNAILSVDTFRSEVARQAFCEGACIINDISGGELDANMFSTVASLNIPYILMHMRGTPQTMKNHTTYDNIVKEITEYFQQKISILQNMGLKDILIDPGFGFAKTTEQNFRLLSHLNHFKILGAPLLVGLSRKSMIWKTLNAEPSNALNGTTALNMIALIKGASILRVHDVKEATEVIKLYSAININT